jgi:dihydrofolate reductase
VGKLIVNTSLSLDGVMQAPGRADEDTRDGFEHGGWAIPYHDEVMGEVIGRSMSATEALLLGRRTYEDLHSYWPKQKANPFTEVLNNIAKYVVSTTLSEPLPWANSRLIEGEVATRVRRLKDEAQADIVVIGSGELAQTLAREQLIDQYLLLIHPLVLGSGRKLFPEAGPPSGLRLVDSVPTTTGVVIATYESAHASV